MEESVEEPKKEEVKESPKKEEPKESPQKEEETKAETAAEEKSEEKTEEPESIEVDKQNGEEKANGESTNIEEEVAGQELQTVDEATCDDGKLVTKYSFKMGSLTKNIWSFIIG